MHLPRVAFCDSSASNIRPSRNQFHREDASLTSLTSLTVQHAIDSDRCGWVSGEEGLRSFGAGAVERGALGCILECSCEIDLLIVARQHSRARSCDAVAISRTPHPARDVARAAGQLPGEYRQVPNLLRHFGGHDLRGVSRQELLERRTRRRVSKFSQFRCIVFFSNRKQEAISKNRPRMSHCRP